MDPIWRVRVVLISSTQRECRGTSASLWICCNTQQISKSRGCFGPESQTKQILRAHVSLTLLARESVSHQLHVPIKTLEADWVESSSSFLASFDSSLVFMCEHTI